MAAILPSYPDQPETTYRVTLSGRVYVLTLRWSERRAGWYVDVSTDEDRPLVAGRRLCPVESPLAGIVDLDAPPGVLVCTGPDAYQRDDLGGSLLLLYVGPDEIAEPAAPPWRVLP